MRQNGNVSEKGAKGGREWVRHAHEGAKTKKLIFFFYPLLSFFFCPLSSVLAKGNREGVRHAYKYGGMKTH